MLSNTLKNIHNYLNGLGLFDNKKVEDFLCTFEAYEKNSYIYPEYFISELKLFSQDECYRLFSYLVEFGILKKVYKVICPHCQHVTNEIFESLNTIEEYIFCEECSNKVFYEKQPYKYVILLFRVIEE